MFGFLASFLLKLPGLADGLFGYLNKRSDNTVLTHGQDVNDDVTLNQAQLAAYVEDARIKALLRKQDQESSWTAWMMPALFSVCFIHFAAIVFDSMCLFGHEIGSWRIAVLPGAYDNLEMGLLGTVAGIKTIKGVGEVVKKIFVK